MKEGNKKVLGHGIYVELVSKDKKALAQFLLTPEAKLSDGSTANSTRFFRLIRSWQSRGNWSIAMNMQLYNKINRQQEQGLFVATHLPFPTEEEFHQGINISNKIREYFYEEIMTNSFIKFINSYLDSTAPHWLWEFSGDPFVVPVSEADLRSISERVTPQNLMNKIKKIREAKDYPERKSPISPGAGWLFEKPISSLIEEPSLV